MSGANLEYSVIDHFRDQAKSGREQMRRSSKHMRDAETVKKFLYIKMPMHDYINREPIRTTRISTPPNYRKRA